MQRVGSFPLTLLLAAALIGCSGDDRPNGAGAPAAGEGSAAVRVVATTGMIGDAATRIGGDLVQVDTLMGPGVDPHLYKASEGDLSRLTGADLILYNGLHLEGKMGDVLVKLARQRPVVAISESVPEDRLREPPELEGLYDPHLWFDVGLWAETLTPILDALIDVAPQHAEAFRTNAEAYRQELVALDRWVESEIAAVPASGRVLITAHDAFGYFGRRYGIEVVGLQGLSTVSEAGLKDIERVVDLVVDRGIKALFIESSVPRRAIEAVQAACRARGSDVAIGGELFSDAMGSPGTAEGTYVGMVRHNVTTIVAALK